MQQAQQKPDEWQPWSPGETLVFREARNWGQAELARVAGDNAIRNMMAGIVQDRQR